MITVLSEKAGKLAQKGEDGGSAEIYHSNTPISKQDPPSLSVAGEFYDRRREHHKPMRGSKSRNTIARLSKRTGKSEDEVKKWIASP